ncbi:UTP--glucose-1-phosphate uridylyltransferase GalU [Acetobacteraceae bacterium]|nr:UTP--glucose-1-phosphate uridylyltransferase GalU [Acetobacteraceae bacterium]
MTKPLRKAVLPVAGLGTRFLPATKATPKEMLPVVDKPLIQYAIDEAREAGIEEFCLITARGKDNLIDYFDVAYELESMLKKRHKKVALKVLEESSVAAGSLVAVRQQNPLGLGHAIWCARSFVGSDPFAVLLPDDIVLGKPGCLKQLVDTYHKTGGNIVAVEEVDPSLTNRYGVLDIESTEGKLVKVKGFVEKPAPENAPSNLAIIGRYIFEANIMDELAGASPGEGGEIQLTDAMDRLLKSQPFYGLKYEGQRFDCGNKLGFLEAQLACSLMREDLASGVREFLKKYI